MKNILIVDDSSTVRKLASFLLKSEEFKIYQAEDGDEALVLAKNTKIDLLVTDYNMPNMNGIELAKALRALVQYQDLPILMLSTESGSKLREKGRALGLIGWIVKPLNPQVFKSTIHKVLEKVNS